MGEKEDKGFVVKDRRKVSLDDLDKGEEAGGSGKEESKEEQKVKDDFKSASRKSDEEAPYVLPEVTFATFIFSLSSSALVHLGEIPDPGSQHVSIDLPLAKQIIDTLGMLDEKTRGNLDADEERLVKSVLYDLRMRFVQKSGSRKS